MTLVCGVHARSMIDNAEPDFTGTGILLRGDIDLRLVAALSVFERIAQQVLNALR